MTKNFCNFFITAVVTLILGFNSELYSQNIVDFSFEKTNPNHSVLILPEWHPVIKELELLDSLPNDMILGFEKDFLKNGDLIGVFFKDNNQYTCAGSLNWKENDFNMLPVWGEDPAGAKNGMEMGERMIWLAQKKNNIIYEVEVSYQKPLMAIYLKDGASAVLGMRLKRSELLHPKVLF